jgi:hypothetical protein
MLNLLLQILSFILLLDPFRFASNGWQRVEGIGSLFAGFGGAHFGDDIRLLVGDSKFLRDAVQKKYSPDLFVCRAEQAGQGLLVLVFVEFVLSKILYFTKVLSKLVQALVFRKSFTFPEFSLYDSMVRILYFQALLVFSFPLAPAVAVYSVFMLIINIQVRVPSSFQQIYILYICVCVCGFRCLVPR